MAKNSDVNYGLVASLPPATMDAVAGRLPGNGTAAEKVSGFVTSLLRDLATGGIFIPPDWAARVRAVLDPASPERITETVEKVAQRRGDCTVVEWVVDPTQVNFYREQADNNGLTLEQQVKAHLDYAFANGWLGTGAPEPFKILLTGEQYRRLQERFLKDIVTGADVMAEFDKTAPIEEEEDPVLASLRRQ